MKNIIVIIFLLLTSCISGAQISDAKECIRINNETIKKCLIETFDQDWYNEFCVKKGKFFFVAIVGINGKVKTITKYSLKSGISENDFQLFKSNLEKKYQLCISNNNPDINENDFIKIIEKGDFSFTFLYQCEKKEE